MSDLPPDRVLLSEVQEGAEAMALLAGDDETFRAAVDAFRAQDGESMERLLARHELGERCELVCHWLRSKECVLLCLELSGPPSLEEEAPDARELAEVVAKVSADEELVQQIAIAIDERDADAWAALVTQHELERVSHLLCHWACTVHYRLVCDVVCQSLTMKRAELVPELQAAGQAIGRLAADEKTFAASVEAVSANDCEWLRATLAEAELAAIGRYICEWFCSWRCMLVCLGLCRMFPIERLESPIEEMLEFARAGGRLAAEQGALERLAAAVLREDAETLQSLAKEFEFERYCIQFCHWVCFVRCQLFCICVSPPETLAVFTKIGGLYYDIDVASKLGEGGLTVAEQRAFFNTLRLNGGISLVNGAPPVEYRFETAPTSPRGGDASKSDPAPPTLPAPIPAGAWVPVLSPQIEPTNIGSFIRFKLPFIEVIEVWVNTPASGPSIYNITPDTEGWIQVPPMFPVPPMVPSGPQWQFVPGADLLQLDTITLKPYVESIDEELIEGGSEAKAPFQTDVHFGIRMRQRNVGDTGDGSDAGTCDHIAINNTKYHNISHHPYWPGGLWSPKPNDDYEIAVAAIGIAELVANPCSDLHNSLTVQFTAAHSNMGDVSVSLEGPGGPYAFDLSPAAPEIAGESWFGTATPHGWSFAALPPCAYLLKLSVDVLLTTGDADITPEPLVDYIAFCKGAG